MIPPVFTRGAAKEVADLVRDTGRSFQELVTSVTHTYAPQLRVWAAQNLYRCKDKLDAENAKRSEAGLVLIPIRFALPALAKVADDDDDEMLGLWARLFANLQDPSRRLSPNKVFIHLLSEMEPLDAALLTHVVRSLPKEQCIESPQTRQIVGMTGTAIGVVADRLAAPIDQVTMSLHNLERLGCFRAEQNVKYIIAEATPADVSPWTQGWPWISTPNASFHLTHLGWALVEACTAAGGTSTSQTDTGKPD